MWLSCEIIFEQLGFIKNAVWTYPAAVLAPATIWGIFKNSVERGIRFGLLWSVIATAWKWNKENGLILIPERFAIAGNKGYGPRDYDIENQVIRQHHPNPEGWKGWPFPVDSVKTWWTPTVEPTWKKHVSPEEAKRGPPTNF